METRVVSALPKATGFTRMAMALAAQHGDLYKAAAYARAHWDRTTPEVAPAIEKTAVLPQSTADSALNVTAMQSEFLELLRAATIIDKIPGIRRVPFATKIVSVTAGTSAHWVGEAAPTAISKLTVAQLEVAFAKIQAEAVITDDLARRSDPSAETVVRRDVINAVADFQNRQFIDSTVASSADNPAAITYGCPSVASSGITHAQIDADIDDMFAIGEAANIDYSTSGCWIMRERTARYLGRVLTTGGAVAWPTINIKGGIWHGLPVITSNAIPVDTGDDCELYLVSGSEIIYASGAIELAASNQAAVQLSDSPSAGASTLTSLWQEGMTSIRANLWCNWLRARDEGVIALTDVSY